MKTLRTIAIGTLIWTLGVSAYALSFYVPLIEDVEKQANMVLFAAVIPIVWLACQLYYNKGHVVHGLTLGLSFFFISGLLDALITVPFLIIPSGGGYVDFYSDLAFWAIGLEFITVSTLYWYFNIRQNTQTL